MTRKAAITINRPRADVERLWQSSDHPENEGIRFLDAPGDRGTEVHVQVDTSGGGLGETLQKVRGTEPLAKVKDDLRRFKQLVETGVIARSDSTPEGELLERKSDQRPAQPVEA